MEKQYITVYLGERLLFSNYYLSAEEFAILQEFAKNYNYVDMPQYIEDIINRVIDGFDQFEELIPD